MSTVEEALATWRNAHRANGPGESRLLGLRLFWVRLGPLRVPVPHPGQLHWHDLHHLALGYEPDLVGEMEISAFELRTGVTTLMVLLLCLAGVGLGVLWAPRRTVRAWRAARGCRNLYACPTPHHEVLQWRREALLEWLRLPTR